MSLPTDSIPTLGPAGLTLSAAPPLPRWIWVSLIAAPLSVAFCVYLVAQLVSLPLNETRVVVGLIALIGVLSSSILSSAFSIYSLRESVRRGETERRHARELADAKAQHDTKLADAKAQHETALADAKAQHEKALASAQAEHDAALASARANHEKELADQAAGHAKELAAENRSHQQAFQAQANKHDKEREELKYARDLRKAGDELEYQETLKRIRHLNIAAGNANDRLQKLAERAAEISAEAMVENTLHIFVTVSPLFAPPPEGAPRLPQTVRKQLESVRGCFTTVFLALSEKESEREKDEYIADLAAKLIRLDEAVTKFGDAIQPAKDELTSRLMTRSSFADDGNATGDGAAHAADRSDLRTDNDIERP